MRTIAAFLIAPAIPVILFIGYGLISQHVGVPTLVGLWDVFCVLSLLSFGVCYTFGVAAFAVLKSKRRESVVAYAIIGGIIGAFMALVKEAAARSHSHFHDLPSTVTLCVALGIAGASGFAMIRGVRRNAPNQSSHPTLANERG